MYSETKIGPTRKRTFNKYFETKFTVGLKRTVPLTPILLFNPSKVWL